jgi:hypothetical protein
MQKVTILTLGSATSLSKSVISFLKFTATSSLQPWAVFVDHEHTELNGTCTEHQGQESVPTHLSLSPKFKLLFVTQARTKDLDQIQLIDLDPKVRDPHHLSACCQTYANSKV